MILQHCLIHESLGQGMCMYHFMLSHTTTFKFIIIHYVLRKSPLAVIIIYLFYTNNAPQMLKESYLKGKQFFFRLMHLVLGLPTYIINAINRNMLKLAFMYVEYFTLEITVVSQYKAAFNIYNRGFQK
jgi:hypothetical protein